MFELEIKDTDNFLSLGELLIHSEVTDGKIITDQFKWIKGTVNCSTIYLANRTLLNKINFNALNFKKKFRHEGRDYLIRLLTKKEYEDWLLPLVNQCVLSDIFLKTNTVQYIGAGSWLSNGEVFGMCGTNNLVAVDPLTISKDIGWRPVIELIGSSE